jgi:ubiquinone biosynthesis protein
LHNRAAEIPGPAGSRPGPRPPARAGGALVLRRLGLPQGIALLGFALACAWDVAGVQISGLLRGEDRQTRRERRWERIAARAAATLGALKGVFAKLGQFAAMRLDLLPASATRGLAALRDRVPPLAPARIHRVIERELGAPMSALFAHFDDVPLGAASIAQVHHARLHDGREVAVKVQYPWLEASLATDLAIVRALLSAFSALAGRNTHDARRLFQEFGAGVRDELDFEREARVAAEIAANLAGDERIVVPEVVPSHSGRRVLSVRYHEALPLTEPERLRERGIPLPAVLQILAKAYATQIFVDGLFHADPHPGNLFVLDEEDAARSPRVLFVDFGLSRHLDPALRRELRKGLLALMQRDLDAFLDGMQRMEMIAPGALPRVRRAVEAMFERIAGHGGAMALQGAQVLSLKDEAKRLLQDTPGLQLPNDLLLYAKTLSYLFALGRDLDPEVDMMQLSLPYALRFLAERDPA